MKNALILSLLFLFCGNSTIWAQPVNNLLGDVVMPPPSTASLGKYVDIPVSLYTGVPNIGVPIHTVSEGPLSVSIGLSYHASGMKVGEPASWVGLGWALNAGGMISRTVQGIADDQTGGYLYTNQPGVFPTVGYPDCVNGQPPVDPIGNDLGSVASGSLDSEPDIYSFNVGGYTGKFYISRSGEAVLIPLQDILIDYTMTTGGITDFIMTAPDGSKYYFGESGDGNPARETMSSGAQFAYTTGWKLKKITDANDLYSITFEYETEEYSYRSKSSYSSFGSGAPYTHMNIVGSRLVRIQSTKEQVLFKEQATVREDLDFKPPYYAGIGGAYALQSIEISTGDFCREFVLNQSYYEDNSTYQTGWPCDKRLRLDAVQEQVCGGASKPPFVFSYYGDVNNTPANLPHRLSPAT
ncbi:MAG: hypothetical protein AAGD05_12120, partial [Bacteroidota bacterium]